MTDAAPSPLPPALLERLGSAAVAEGLVDAAVARLPVTPIGPLTVAQTERGLVRVAFAETDEAELLAEVAAGVGPRVVRSDAETAALRDALLHALEADPAALQAVPVDWRLVRAPFRRRVLTALHDDVPAGETVSYGALAARAGSPGAARAVGTACARNPVPLVVPCHRVLPGTGGLGAYAGGAPRKLALLEREGWAPPAARGAGATPR